MANGYDEPGFTYDQFGATYDRLVPVPVVPPIPTIGGTGVSAFLAPQVLIPQKQKRRQVSLAEALVLTDGDVIGAVLLTQGKT